MRGLVLKASALRFFDSFLLIVPFYTVMFAERGLTPAQIGVVLGAWSITGVALQIPFGVLADHMPRRWLLFAGQMGRTAGFVLWLAFPSFWGFLAGLVLWGAKSASMAGTFEALVYDELKAMGRESEYARVIGRTQGARFGGVVAASLVAAAGAGLGYTGLVLASIGSSVAASAAALLLPAAPRAVTAGRPDYLAHLRRGASDAVSLPGVLPLLVFIAAIQAVATACADYWQLFGREVGLPAAGIALFIAALAATEAVSSLVAHRMRGASGARIYGLVLAAGAGLVAAAASFQPWSVLLVIACLGLYRLVDVNADARFQAGLRPQTRATVAAVKVFAMQCATTALILGFGLIAQAGGYRASFLAYGAALAAIGAGYALAATLRGRRSPSP